ncbi:beta-ketoacyl synthase N-terminal-like domain-containing protein, partial [Eubacterium aggregans]|uniref:beta-ketoacyl synthase N-terminal-like domain-containing protein n=1 Tax=Eubacterium aggregans TaxID=81409 RepID=UPI003F2E8210
MTKRRVVITGLGAVTPLGNTAADSWSAARAGVCDIGPITLFDPVNHKVKIAGEVKDLDMEAFIPKKEIKRMDRCTQLAVIAAQGAMADSGLNMASEDTTRYAVIIGSGIGGLHTTELQEDRGQEKGFDRVSPFFIPMVIANIAPGQIAIAHGFKGMCSCIVTACASSNNAIDDAFRHIRDGYAEVVLTGGAESSITPLGMGGFTSIKALTTESDASRA